MTTLRTILSDPVTRHMRTDPTRIAAAATVAEALEYIRGHEIGGRVVYFYVVDADDRLVGVVPTRRLLRARPDTPIADVMIAPVVSVPDSATVLDACEFFTLHKLLAFADLAAALGLTRDAVRTRRNKLAVASFQGSRDRTGRPDGRGASQILGRTRPGNF